MERTMHKRRQDFSYRAVFKIDLSSNNPHETFFSPPIFLSGHSPDLPSTQLENDRPLSTTALPLSRWAKTFPNYPFWCKVFVLCMQRDSVMPMAYGEVIYIMNDGHFGSAHGKVMDMFVALHVIK